MGGDLLDELVIGGGAAAPLQDPKDRDPEGIIFRYVVEVAIVYRRVAAATVRPSRAGTVGSFALKPRP